MDEIALKFGGIDLQTVRILSIVNVLCMQAGWKPAILRQSRGSSMCFCNDAAAGL